MKAASQVSPREIRSRRFLPGKIACLGFAWITCAHAADIETAAFESEVSLFTEPGQAYLGDQLKNFRTSLEISAKNAPQRLELLQTESRDFLLRGEVFLGGTFQETRFPEEYFSGFTIFIRETDLLHRYELNPVRLRNKRRVQEGKETAAFIHVPLIAEPELEKWLPFSVLATHDEIVFEIDGQTARLPGPLDTDGRNFIGLAPKTKLRNVSLAFPKETLEPKPTEQNESINRTWTAADGRTLEGQLLDSDETAITVRRTSDHRIFTIPLESLSDTDREFLSSGKNTTAN